MPDFKPGEIKSRTTYALRSGHDVFVEGIVGDTIAYRYQGRSELHTKPLPDFAAAVTSELPCF